MSKIARVQLPDGRVARMEVPDDATPEQIQSFAQKQFAAKPKKAPEPGGVLGWISNNVFSPVNELAVGAVEGLSNLGQTIVDPIIAARIQSTYGTEAAKRFMHEAPQKRAKVFSAARNLIVTREDPLARTVGRVLPSIPLSAEGIAGRVATGALGGIMGREPTDDPNKSAAIGAAANVVIPPVISGIAKSAPAKALARGISRVASPVVTPIVNAADDVAEAALPSVNRFLGRPPPTPLRGLPALPQPPAAVLAELGRKAQTRAARFSSLGVDNPTTGMVTRDPAAFSFEQNTAKLQGVGDDLARQMKEVETKLVDKGRTMVRNLGGAKGAEATGKGVEDFLDAMRTQEQQLTSRLYTQVRETRGDVMVGSLDDLNAAMQRPDLRNSADVRPILKSIKSYVKDVGDNGRLTISQAEELRKFIGKQGAPNMGWARKELIGSLDDSVVNAVGDDAFRVARANARAGFEKWSKTFAGKLADEKLAPELLTKRILGDGVKLSDLRSLKRSILTASDVEQGQTTWRAVQAQSIDDLLSKSVNEDGNLVGSTLSREFNKSALKFREILDPADFKMLRRLAAATRDVKAYPVGHSVNTSNTAVTLANMFDNAPAKVRDGWLKLIGKVGARAGAHVGAAAAVGPFGNVAVEGIRAAGTAAAANRAEQQAANALMEKIRLAQNPEAAAAAIKEAQAAAASNPAVADFLRKAGMGQLIGGVAASEAQ